MKVSKKLDLKAEVFTRSVQDIITREELANKLKSGKQMRIKLGIDATAPDLHIGHAASLWKIRALQEHGHKAVIILGEFTTRIGDPTDKSATRPILAPEVIRKNIAALRKQVESILLTGKDVYELRKNSEWYGTMKVAEFLRLCTHVSHARLIERDMFQERMRQRREIAIAEMLYPILQGYDSVAIKSDLAIFGSDQLFNEHVGRLFQEKFGQAPQVLIPLTIVPGLDGGAKMSKSLGNYIALNDTPTDKFGKTMRVLDTLIIPYLETYTDVPLHNIQALERSLGQGANPMEAKLQLSQAIVARYHGDAVARQERDRFVKTFSQRGLPDKMPTKKIRIGAWDASDLLLALGLAPSKSEVRRLLAQGAVECDGAVISADARPITIREGSVIRVGKRRFVKVLGPNQ